MHPSWVGSVEALARNVSEKSVIAHKGSEHVATDAVRNPANSRIRPITPCRIAGKYVAIGKLHFERGELFVESLKFSFERLGPLPKFLIASDHRFDILIFHAIYSYESCPQFPEADFSRTLLFLKHIVQRLCWFEEFRLLRACRNEVGKS